MCGGTIVADPNDPAAAVLRHTRTDRHVMARGPRKRCGRCRMAVIPGHRSLCHYCTRTVAMERAAA